MTNYSIYDILTAAACSMDNPPKILKTTEQVANVMLDKEVGQSFQLVIIPPDIDVGPQANANLLIETYSTELLILVASDASADMEADRNPNIAQCYEYMREIYARAHSLVKDLGTVKLEGYRIGNTYYNIFDSQRDGISVSMTATIWNKPPVCMEGAKRVKVLMD